MKELVTQDKIEVDIIENKLYVHLNINGLERDIELKEVKNYQQDYLYHKITDSITESIVEILDFKDIYKGIQSLINLYWMWQSCPFKNEELSDLTKYRYRYEIKINNDKLTLFFDWKEFVSDIKQMNGLFYHKLYDIVYQTITPKVKEKLEEMEYTSLQATIQCACSPTNKDIWDNLVN